MRIETLTIKNFKNIDHKDINLKGRTMWLIGPNNIGKSSIIQAALGIMPEEPLKEGESKGDVVIVLSDKSGIAYTCTFKFSKKSQKPTLTIADSTGAVQKAPVTLFNELFNVTDFDIDGWLKLSGTKQVEAIKNLIGVDWEEVDEEYAKKFKERTDKNRDLEKVLGKLTDTVYKKDLPVKPEDISIIQAKFSEVSKHNETVLRGETTKESHLSEIKEREANISEFERQIKNFQDSIETSKKLISDAEAKVIAIDQWLKLNPKKQIEDVQAEYDAAVERNLDIERNNGVKALKDEADGISLELNDIEKRLSDIKDLKVNQFREAQDKGLIPVKGLSLDYEENILRLDGLPLNSEQINTARRITVGLEIQAALMSAGQVRIAKFDASLVDSKNTAEIIAWAKEKDIQLFIECVARDHTSLTIEVVEEE